MNDQQTANCKRLFKVVQILSEAYKDVAASEEKIRQELTELKDKVTAIEAALKEGNNGTHI